MHLSVWKDQILLFWDGIPPPNCSISRAHIMEKPDVLLPYWKHIEKYARWSKRLSCFMLTLSKQNLQRIYAQFGKIDVRGGYNNIQELKDCNAFFKCVTERAQKIKDGALEDIPYKAQPLGRYQHVGVNLLTFCERVPLFASCGVGKTFMVLVSTQEQFRRGMLTPGKVLICGKLATLETGWLADCNKFTHMKTSVVWTGSSYKRREKLLEALNEPADIYLINHEGLRTLEDELVAKRFDKVVVDESTILKGYHGDSLKLKGGAFGKSLMRVAASAKWRVIMSGTPAPNGIHDLWGQMRFLDPYGFMLEGSYNDFRNTFMLEKFFGNPDDPNTVSTWIPKSGSEQAVSDLHSPLSYRVRIRDHIHDLPEETVCERYCSMTPGQEEHYIQMCRSLMTIVDDKTIAVDIALAKISKLRQITGGFLIDANEENHPLLENPKIDLLDGLLNEEIDKEEKVVIFAQFRWEIELIENRYKDHGIVSVYGGNSSTSNMENIKRFINEKDIRIIVLHPQSAAHGITLTCAHYMVFYSISYSAEFDYQARARICRAGQRHPMFFYYLLSKADPEIIEETIDEIMYDTVKHKNLSQQLIIDADIVSRFRNSIRKESKSCSKGKRKQSSS